MGTPAAALAEGCDTVMFCLSKGLAAPVGSVLVGDADAMAEARRIRKVFGGGMRQAGVLAAAGLVALEEMLPRLAEDHVTARRLAEQIAEIDAFEIDPETVETNIVFFKVRESFPLTAAELVARLRAEGVLANALGPDRIRMVTHYEISSGDVDEAAGMIRRVVSGVQAG